MSKEQKNKKELSDSALEFVFLITSSSIEGIIFTRELIVDFIKDEGLVQETDEIFKRLGEEGINLPTEENNG